MRYDQEYTLLDLWKCDVPSLYYSIEISQRLRIVLNYILLYPPRPVAYQSYSEQNQNLCKRTAQWDVLSSQGIVGSG